MNTALDLVVEPATDENNVQVPPSTSIVDNTIRLDYFKGV